VGLCGWFRRARLAASLPERADLAEKPVRASL